MDITSEIGTPAVLEQTAEECVELAEAITSLLRLAHACQKEARRLRGENPTPATEAECRAAIREEMADVSVCLGRLNEAGYPIDMRAVRAKIERWESRICARNAGEAANSPLDDVLGHEVTSYLSSVKIASEGDLIRRGEAMNAIRRACVLSHIPWKSSSPEGKTTLEALKAINDTPPVQWTPKEAACLVFDMVAERHIASSAPLDFVCSCVYGEMDQEFRTHAGIGMDGKS